MPRRDVEWADADTRFRAAFWAADAGAVARAYLNTTRAISLDVARSAGVGYFAPQTATKEMLEWIPRGLEQGGALVFPIRTADGEVVGFKFRAVPGVAAEQAPRYTGTTGEMHGAMFGWHQHVDSDERILAIEGEIDQLSLDTVRQQHPDLPLPLAWYGNTLTSKRLEWMQARGIQHVLLALDADAGGWKGVLRSGRLLGEAGIAHDVLRLPAGMDPNEVLTAGGSDILAHFIRQGPRRSLLEAHAEQLTMTGISAVDPLYARRVLVETAVATERLISAREVSRACRTVMLPTAMFRDALPESLWRTGTRVTSASETVATALRERTGHSVESGTNATASIGV
jgi:hypothetical protein